MNSDVERVKHDILYPYISKYNYSCNATYTNTYRLMYYFNLKLGT